MIPPPLSPGLYLCDYVIIEENTRKVSLIGCFNGIGLDDFPSVPQPFSVFLALTDGLGTGRVRLVVGQPEKDEIIYQREGTVHFPDKVTEVYLHFRVRECEFPEPCPTPDWRLSERGTIMKGEQSDISTESLKSVYVFDDGPGDKTIRPMGPEIPRGWPRRQPPTKKSPTDRPPTDQS